MNAGEILKTKSKILSATICDYVDSALSSYVMVTLVNSRAKLLNQLIWIIAD
jgi:hypothetical protein